MINFCYPKHKYSHLLIFYTNILFPTNSIKNYLWKLYLIHQIPAKTFASMNLLKHWFQYFCNRINKIFFSTKQISNLLFSAFYPPYITLFFIGFWSNQKIYISWIEEIFFLTADIFSVPFPLRFLFILIIAGIADPMLFLLTMLLSSCPYIQSLGTNDSLVSNLHIFLQLSGFKNMELPLHKYSKHYQLITTMSI